MTEPVKNPVLKTKNHTIVFKPYANGYDQEAIDTIILEKRSEGELTYTQVANRESIRRLVISVDGETEDVVKKILEMKKPEYVAVIDKINELTSEDEQKKSPLKMNTTA